MNPYPVKPAGPVEAWLREPVELWAGVLHATAALLCIAAPWALMMTPAVAWVAGAVFVLLSAQRFRQGLFIVRYHRSMRQLPTFVMTAEQVPFSRKRLYLGKGFRWGQQHTQRLADTLAPTARRFLEPSAGYVWARSVETRWEHVPILRVMALTLAIRSRWNPFAPLPPVGGNPALHAVEPYETEVWMDLGERVGHTLVLGTTRVGKTRLAEILITQDIRRGDVVIVFDPKGDADLLRRMYAEAVRAGRQAQFYLFHLGYPHLSARYNAVANFTRVTEVASRVASQLSGEGNSAAFKEFAWTFVNGVAQALNALGQVPSYKTIRQYIANIDPLLQRYYEHWLDKLGLVGWREEVVRIESGLDDKNLPFALKGRNRRCIALCQFSRGADIPFDATAFGLRNAFEYDRTYFDKITASLLPLLDKLTSGQIGELLSPDYEDLDDPRPILDWTDVIAKGGIVYVGLDALTDTPVASVTGNSMFAELTSIAGRIYKFGTQEGLGPMAGTPVRRAISIHADEFNELIGDEFIPLLNKAGGAGYQVTAYTQTWSDVEARIGNRAKAGQIGGNFNTMIMLRVKELATAELLTNQLPKVQVNQLTQVSGAQDTAADGADVHFTSANQDRLSSVEKPMLTPAEMVTLPKGQAFALIEGGQLFKIRMPLPSNVRDPVMPESLDRIAGDMRRRYKTGEAWWRVGLDREAGVGSAAGAFRDDDEEVA